MTTLPAGRWRFAIADHRRHYVIDLSHPGCLYGRRVTLPKDPAIHANQELVLKCPACGKHATFIATNPTT